MDFNLTSEQKLLADSLARFFGSHYAFDARKAILASPDGFSREVWSKLAEMGLLALQVPAEHGGMGPAPVETMVAMRAMGRALSLEPYLTAAVLAPALVRSAATDAQKGEILPAIASGERILAFAHGEEGARYDAAYVATTATRSGARYVLRGRKAVVLHATSADTLLVSARTSGEAGEPSGISLFLVPPGAAGVRLVPYKTIDGRPAADVVLSDVDLGQDALLGAEGAAWGSIASALSLGVAALCAEAVGALDATLAATVEYTKTRKQFGAPIAKFQALQHRMVNMLVHVEQARSMSYLATMRADDDDTRERQRAVSAAKVMIGTACRAVGQEAVQLHGGLGVTDEMAVSHYFKRLLAIDVSLGDTSHHVERFIAATAAV